MKLTIWFHKNNFTLSKTLCQLTLSLITIFYAKGVEKMILMDKILKWNEEILGLLWK